ncbi:MAG: hypothetical protein ACYTAF_12310 [Planctomycetota bacterium]
MGKAFKDFVTEFQTALKNGDQDFIRTVYQYWVDTSGALPPEYKDTFPELVIAEAGSTAELPVKSVETFDDFGVVQFSDPADPGASTSMTFRRKGNSWIMFNERSGFTRFKKVYTLWYAVEGGKVAIRFNGKRSPLVPEHSDRTAGATVTPINSALNVGPNEVGVESVDGQPKVQVRINSAKEGEIADSSVGDALLWEGVVSEPVKLTFNAE